ncbi:hypothetical protein CTU88_13875 [Streptomyces sp. JV178]|nr:hypothetical protein CTU88_13875 [Streptomyces sp. JV178]
MTKSTRTVASSPPLPRLRASAFAMVRDHRRLRLVTAFLSAPQVGVGLCDGLGVPTLSPSKNFLSQRLGLARITARGLASPQRIFAKALSGWAAWTYLTAVWGWMPKTRTR